MAYEIQKPGIVNRTETVELEAPYYAVCSTAAGTAAKTVTVGDFFRLETGAKVTVRFSNTNTASTPTLNVNGTGATQIRYRNATGTAEAGGEYLASGRTYELVYDGSYWQIVGDIDTMLELSDSISSTSSTTAASSAAVKTLADLISALTDRVASLEGGSGEDKDYSIRPTSDEVRPLLITSTTYDYSYQTVLGNNSNQATEYEVSTPEGGSWAWLLATAVNDDGNWSTGQVESGVAAGGTQVTSIVVPARSGTGGDSGEGYTSTTVHIYTNICWRIA